MEEDEADVIEISSRLIGRLITHLKAMARKPEVDDNLGETLDVFIDHLNETQQYLANGVFNVKFTEAALFLQSSVELYGKKVDILFDNTLEYQMQLCSYEAEEDMSTAIEKIAMRLLKKGRKKRIIVRCSNIGSAGYVLNMSRNLENLLECYSNIPQCEVQRKALEKFLLIIFEKCVQRLCGSHQFLDNHYFLRCDASINEVDLSMAGSDSDCEEVHINENGSTDDDIRSSCLSMSAVVNVTRLPDDIMRVITSSPSNYTNTLIARLIADSQAIAGGKKSTLQVDQELELNDSDHGYNSTPSQLCSESQSCSIRRSNDDSGFFCSNVSNNTIIEIDETCHESQCSVIPEENSESSQAASLFLPMISSTPRRLEPVVRLERLSRKRILFLQGISVTQPQRKRAKCFKWLKTFVAPEKAFEKFYRLHYVAYDEEGRPLALVNDDVSDSDDSSDDGDDNAEMEEDADNVELDDQFEVNDFCKDIISEMVDMVTADAEAATPDAEVATHDAEPGTHDPKVANATDVLPDEQIINSEFGADNLELATFQAGRGTTMLSQSIYYMRSWLDFIVPTINAAEKQPKFDIHAYGTEIISAFPLNKNLAFRDLVKGKSRAEVVRYFMSSLQLANTGNIDFINTTPGTLASNLELRLITTDRYHEHLKEYEAPSENSNREKLARIHAISMAQNLPSTSQGSSLPQPLHNYIRPHQNNRSKRQRIA